jgi:hypothetical protein
MHNLPYIGRRSLVRLRAMMKVARFVTLIAASVALAGAAFAQNPVYRVKDLVADAVAPNAADAGLQGRNEARLEGARQLIERLTLPEDRARATSPIEASAVSRLYGSYQTQGDVKSSSVSGGIRSSGIVTWVFNENDVRAYLEQRGVPYVDQQAALALIVPVASANVNPSDWAAQWVTRSSAGVTGKSDDSVLTPYIASTQGWNRRPDASEIAGELAATRADHGVIAEAYMQGPQYYVRLTDMRASVPNPTIGVVGPYVSLSSAQAGAVTAMERAWKTASVVRSTGSTSVSLIARFQDLQQWTRIRDGLVNSRLVQDLNIESLTIVGADITFSYAGRPEQLASDLRSRGIDLRNGNGGGWVLQVSGAP